ncbi:RdgB/HAM1 family non-canonical purine NTP pyrophosphatase [Brevibacterium sp. 50QC2O2]|jgi:XTP/dITP diphosphohydrolase|uniref:RdgB/HAM1 family non-canonical purine NTP pyrophosphatase n=1 Tax=Brevibacterium TaxID=1696 RepID=UPI00211CFB79|nr:MULTISPECIES: RdgB/HAM1 family non-canonical purine NTP pyrophosphatase [unclassified Brevibacterium]MCQ9369230.1 RdgB/HAM1 family non-canonical purine NTP pyrophosphatase [Brevibacterium sp. 91QC2O2]MCQ9386854.1 RdgB/HAM1 family non-canonical purine NTP pyrophosphatase [Brevibacterium sp. 68QC2CO]MCQ9387327.1 RdgB/HAM1 family non-canonical purine NTP pyrophosphatase [Brevibacterium sp. 50QC2O2]
MSRRIVLATHNEHKARELGEILTPLLGDVDVVTAGSLGLPDPVETGVTFAQNALLKARAAQAATGLDAIADDSGIAVDVMGGAPGILSARWSGTHGADRENLELLLAQMADIPDEHRGASFVCAAAFVGADGSEIVEQGLMPGRLAHEAHGAGGFGYDPIFLVGQGQRTAAELSPEEKNEVSHRGAAFRALAAHLA